MAVKSTDDLVLALAVISQAIGRLIDTLDDRLDHTSDENERRQILLQLPSLESRQLELQAKIIAIQAAANTFPMPSQATLKDLDTATTDLSLKTAAAQRTSVLLGLATNLLSAAEAVPRP